MSKPSICSNHCKSRFITGIIQLSATFDHRNIPSIIQCAGKIFQPCLNFPVVNIRHAHTFNTAPQFTGVLWCDHDTVFHDPNFNGHPVNKPGLRHPFTVHANRTSFNPRVKLAVAKIWHGVGIAYRSRFFSGFYRAGIFWLALIVIYGDRKSGVSITRNRM